ncbi:MAG: hypothetical protein JWO98_4107 [Frankiales bacterium]|nr:hypothetical protein [Frankiales bacterium]
MADDPSDDELAAMAAAALLAVRRQRDTTHDDAAAALAVVLSALAAGLSVMSLVDVIDPAASRDTRRAAVAAELARQARILGIEATWQAVVRDAHTAATTGGSAAAAHVVTAGGVPVEPEPTPWPDPFDPAEWIIAQQLGLAGDIVDAVHRAEAAYLAAEPEDDLLAPRIPGFTDIDLIGITPEEITDLIDQGAGALYYLDEQISDTYLDASTAVYLELGLVEYWWSSMADDRVCSTCGGYESGSPYAYAELPSPPHGGCRCWVHPG